MKQRPLTPWLLPGILFALAAVLLVLGGAAAQEIEPQTSTGPGSPIHPVFPLLDAGGNNVLESDQPLSTMTTCGGCHDTAFIAANNFHADVGLESYGAPGSLPGGRPWDTSPGLFGKWSPIFYRYLSPAGDPVTDLTTPEWIKIFGVRHVGGGPAGTSRDGTPLASLTPDNNDPETAIIDPDTGEAQPGIGRIRARPNSIASSAIGLTPITKRGWRRWPKSASPTRQRRRCWVAVWSSVMVTRGNGTQPPLTSWVTSSRTSFACRTRPRPTAASAMA
jgi:hypothetical protein